jgi:hypothetical protein
MCRAGFRKAPEMIEIAGAMLLLRPLALALSPQGRGEGTGKDYVAAAV